MVDVQIRDELRTASDGEIAEAVTHANPLVLRGLLYQLTGDESLAELPTALVPAGFRGQTPAIVDPDAVVRLQEAAVAFLKACRDSGEAKQSLGPSSRLHRSMELAVGASIPESELEMWIEQMAIDPMVRGLDWRSPPDEARRSEFKVAVVGAGMGGLNAAVHLKRAGLPFVVFEKNVDVGGTWHENRYPGARVDSPSRTYFNAFGVGFELPNAFCPQAVNERYFSWVADHFDVRGQIEFRTEVQSIVWNEVESVWEITVVGPGGPRTWRANAVITAVGFLNRANEPAFPGAEDFEGPQFHTSRWPSGLDLSGKRVAVIGSGATSYQMSPVLAQTAGRLTLFQRTPRWCSEAPGYLKPFAPQVPWLDRNFPFLVNFNRLSASWRARPDALMGVMTVDAEQRAAGTGSPENERMRDQCTAFLKRKLGHRPDLMARMLPDLPPMTSRPVLVDSDDNIYDALLRENVELVADPISRITARGVLTADGVEHPADIIVYATGFRANDYLWPMDIRGKGGRPLADLWAGDGARAYLGTMLPGFPNFFAIYGPNMNPFGTGLSVTDLQEMQTRFALKCLEHLILENRREVDVRADAYARFNAELDLRQATMVYTDPRITNYYLNDFGRCTVNSAFDVRLLWRWLRDPAATVADARPDEPARPWFGEDLVVA